MRARPILLVSLLLCAVTSCEAGDEGEPGSPHAAPDPIRYVALGDSLATGAGAETSYVAEYAGWMEAETGSRVEVANFAVNGWTSQELLDALRKDQRMRSAVAAAHVVTWDIGGNDLLGALAEYLSGACGGNDGQACIREAVDTAIDNTDALLDELLELRDGDATGLRTLNLYLPFVGNPLVAPYLDELRRYLDEFNDRLASSSQAHEVPVADVYRAFQALEDADGPAAAARIAPDGIHPSDRGHEVIAAELAGLGLELGALE